MWPMLVVAEPVGADVTAEQRYARLVAARHAAGTVSTLTVALANLAPAEAALDRWPEAIGTATEGLQLGTASQLLEYPSSQVEHIQGLASADGVGDPALSRLAGIIRRGGARP
jgi:hypothetical protein